MKKEYHRKVNEIASFMHAYYDAAMKSGAVQTGDDVKNQILLAALSEISYKIPGYPGIAQDADNIVACTSSPTVSMPKLVLCVEGGVLQSVVSDNPDAFTGITAITIDYDTDAGSDERALVAVKDTGGKTENAFGNIESICHSAIDIDDVYKQVIR